MVVTLTWITHVHLHIPFAHRWCLRILCPTVVLLLPFGLAATGDKLPVRGRTVLKEYGNQQNFLSNFWHINIIFINIFMNQGRYSFPSFASCRPALPSTSHRLKKVHAPKWFDRNGASWTVMHCIKSDSGLHTF